MGSYFSEIKAGESAWWKYQSPRVFAVKQGELPQTEDSGVLEAFFAKAELPRSESALSRTGLVDEDDPRGRIQTVYTIESIEGAVVKLSKREQVFGTDGKLIESTPAPAEAAPAETSPTAETPSTAEEAERLGGGSPNEPEPAAAETTSGGGLCALRPGRALPLLGLSALALCALVLIGLRRAD
jgi:hypothetical protein